MADYHAPEPSLPDVVEPPRLFRILPTPTPGPVQFRPGDVWRPRNGAAPYRVTLRTDDLVWLTPVNGGRVVTTHKTDTAGWLLIGRECDR